MHARPTDSSASPGESSVNAAMNEAPALLQTLDLVTDIPGRSHVCALNLSIRAGECWGILGPNGAGKTSLLHTLAGLRPPRAGEVHIKGRPLAGLSRREVARSLGVVFQDHQDSFPATVLETALIGRHPFLRPWDIESAADHAAALDALGQLDLCALSDRLVSTLSGGERQRLAIATVLTQNPEILLLDEPTNHLDMHHQLVVMDLVRRLTRAGHAAVACIHDVNLAARYCDRVLLLYPGGEACWGATADMLLPRALERLYGQALVAGEVEGIPVFLPVARSP